jgi:hypothetical protein
MSLSGESSPRATEPNIPILTGLYGIIDRMIISIWLCDNMAVSCLSVESMPV